MNIQSSHESLDQELVHFKMQAQKLEQWNEKLKKDNLHLNQVVKEQTNQLLDLQQQFQNNKNDKEQFLQQEIKIQKVSNEKLRKQIEFLQSQIQSKDHEQSYAQVNIHKSQANEQNQIDKLETENFELKQQLEEQLQLVQILKQEQKDMWNKIEENENAYKEQTWFYKQKIDNLQELVIKEQNWRKTIVEQWDYIEEDNFDDKSSFGDIAKEENHQNQSINFELTQTINNFEGRISLGSESWHNSKDDQMILRKQIWRLEDEVEQERELNDRLWIQNDEFQKTFLKQLTEINELRQYKLQQSNNSIQSMKQSALKETTVFQSQLMTQSRLGTIGIQMQEWIKQYEQRVFQLKYDNEQLLTMWQKDQEKFAQ